MKLLCISVMATGALAFGGGAPLQAGALQVNREAYDACNEANQLITEGSETMIDPECIKHYNENGEVPEQKQKLKGGLLGAPMSAPMLGRGAPTDTYGGGGGKPTCPSGRTWGNAGDYCLSDNIWFCARAGQPASKMSKNCGYGCTIAQTGQADYCTPKPAPEVEKCFLDGRAPCAGCRPGCSDGGDCVSQGMPGCSERSGNQCGKCNEPAPPTPSPAKRCFKNAGWNNPGTRCDRGQSCTGIPGCSETINNACGTCQNEAPPPEPKVCFKNSNWNNPGTRCDRGQSCMGMPGCSENINNPCGHCM